MNLKTLIAGLTMILTISTNAEAPHKVSDVKDIVTVSETLLAMESSIFPMDFIAFVTARTILSGLYLTMRPSLLTTLLGKFVFIASNWTYLHIRHKRIVPTRAYPYSIITLLIRINADFAK